MTRENISSHWLTVVRNDDSTIAQDMMLRHHINNLKCRVLQYQENDGVDIKNDGVNVGVNKNGVGVKLTNTQRKDI